MKRGHSCFYKINTIYYNSLSNFNLKELNNISIRFINMLPFYNGYKKPIHSIQLGDWTSRDSNSVTKLT